MALVVPGSSNHGSNAARIMGSEGGLQEVLTSV